MKKIILTLVVFAFAFTVNAQMVYAVNNQAYADVNVFVVDNQAYADLNVYKVSNQAYAGKNNGNWYFASNQAYADKNIFFVNNQAYADINIFFVNNQAYAGWNKASKKHLMYQINISKYKTYSFECFFGGPLGPKFEFF